MNEIQHDDLTLCIITLAVIIAYTVLTYHEVPRTTTVYESHTVQQGETLSQIVESHHGSLKATQVENSNVIMPGQVIYIAIEGR